MRSIEHEYHGLSLLFVMNLDWFLYLAAIVFALMLGGFVGSL